MMRIHRNIARAWVCGAILSLVIPAAAQTVPATAPATAPAIIEQVKLHQWAQLPRHAGTYPELQLTWQRVDDLTDVLGVYPHPLIASRALVATRAGLFLTQDAGKSFKALPGASAEKIGAVTDIAFALDRTDLFHVATKARGVWSSADNGATFKQIGSRAKGLASDSIVSFEIFAGDISGRTLLACHGESAGGLSRSVDGGETWHVLHKEHHVFRTFTARVATQGIYIVAAKTTDPEAQGIFMLPSLTEPWQEMARDLICTGFAAPLLGNDCILVSTADRGLLRIAHVGGIVKRIGPEDADSWASIGAAWGPNADTQIVYAFDPKKLGMAVWTSPPAREGPVTQPSELIDALPISGPPALHSKGLYTNAIIREGAHLRANATGAVFYAAVNSMLYRAAAGSSSAALLTDVAIRPAVYRFDPVAQQNSLDQLRDSLAQFPRQRNLADAGASMLKALCEHDKALGEQEITVQAKVPAGAARPKAVSVDLSRIGHSPQSELFDDGRHGDGAAGDGLYANAFPMNLLMYKRSDRDWRRPWPGLTGLTVTAAGEGRPLAGVVVPFSIVNPGSSAPFWDTSAHYSIKVEQGKVRRSLGISVHGPKRAILLGVEVPGAWRVGIPGSRKTIDVSGAYSLAFHIRSLEDSTDEVFIHLRDDPVYADPVTTPPVPLLAEGFIPGKKLTTAYQRVVIPIQRLIQDAEGFQPSIVQALVVSGKATKPVQILIDEVTFSFSPETAGPGKVTP